MLRGMAMPPMVEAGQCYPAFALGYGRAAAWAGHRNVRFQPDFRRMEVRGLEPLTSCMPCKRSPN